MTFTGINHHTIKVNNIKMHYIEAGSGNPVILLHGFPETWYAWRKQIPALAQLYHVIAPDLRGYGDTEKPQTGYDKKTMAADIYQLMKSLGYDRTTLIGHDRGARVATRFAKEYSQSVDRLVILDNIPARTIYNSMNTEVAKGHWFWLFNQVPDLPEALITGKEGVWLRHFFTSWCYNPEALSESEIDVYVKSYSQPGAIRGACNDYRAGPEDMLQDNTDSDLLIDCPVLAIWGQDFDQVGHMFDVLSIWKQYAIDVRGISIPQCGHLPHEEQSERVNRYILNFMQDWKSEQAITVQPQNWPVPV